jgi:ABC-type glycerol-3-phosphate transport system substrate-binding protein
MKTAVMAAAVVGSALALAGCGGGGGSTAAETSTTGTSTTETTTTPATTEAATTGTATTSAPTREVTVIPIRVVNGQPQGGIQRPKVDQGDKVLLVVRTDSGEAVHLHGYNIEKPVVPGKPVRLPFTASIAGRFEVELHPTDSLLAVIEVEP